MNYSLQFERSMLFCKIITIFLYKMLTQSDYLRTKKDNYYEKKVPCKYDFPTEAYSHINTYTYRYAHKHIHSILKHMHTFTHKDIYRDVHIHTCTHIDTKTYIHLFALIHMHVLQHTHI